MADTEIRLVDIRQEMLAFAKETDVDSMIGTTLANRFISDAQLRFIGDQGLEKTWTVTTVIGERNIFLPRGFISARHVLYNGDPIDEVQFRLEDFSSTGNGHVDRYTLWGEPYRRMILGPMAPSAAYTLTTYYFSEPKLLSHNDDVPDVPRRFRIYLAHGGAAQQCRIDGDLAGAQDHERIFARGQEEYQKWRLYNHRNNLPQTMALEDY